MPEGIDAPMPKLLGKKDGRSFSEVSHNGVKTFMKSHLYFPVLKITQDKAKVADYVLTNN